MKRICFCAWAVFALLFSNIIEKLANFNTYFIFLRSFFVKYAQFLYLLILPATAVQNLQNKHAYFSFAGCAIPTADFSESYVTTYMKWMEES